MKYLQLLAITFMALMMASFTATAHDSLDSKSTAKGSASYSTPSMAYSIKKTRSMTNAHCAGHGKTALKRSSFGSIKTGKSFAVGSRGGYKATFICAASSTQVVAIVSGPGFSQARTYAKKLTANFATH